MFPSRCGHDKSLAVNWGPNGNMLVVHIDEEPKDLVHAPRQLQPLQKGENLEKAPIGKPHTDKPI